jgi:hypothetical protein
MAGFAAQQIGSGPAHGACAWGLCTGGAGRADARGTTHQSSWTRGCWRAAVQQAKSDWDGGKAKPLKQAKHDVCSSGPGLITSLSALGCSFVFVTGLSAVHALLWPGSHALGLSHPSMRLSAGQLPPALKDLPRRSAVTAPAPAAARQGAVTGWVPACLAACCACAGLTGLSSMSRCPTRCAGT